MAWRDPIPEKTQSFWIDTLELGVNFWVLSEKYQPSFHNCRTNRMLRINTWSIGLAQEFCPSKRHSPLGIGSLGFTKFH